MVSRPRRTSMYRDLRDRRNMMKASCAQLRTRGDRSRGQDGTVANAPEQPATQEKARTT